MTPHTPMPDSQRLEILRVLREQCGLSQTTAARYCGLAGRQARLTLGAWERGDYAPNESRRRAALIRYLWDHLRLRREPDRFAALWTILVEAWGWDELSEAEWRGLTQQARSVRAATKPAAAAPFQAPFLIPHFVGRGSILQTIADQLQTGSNIVALVGMGGVGKTTLATRIAHHLRTHFPDGVLWGDVTNSEPLSILQSWAQAYGCDYSNLFDLPSRAAALRNLLTDKSVLYIMDNVVSHEQLVPLLPNGVSNAVLITTRNEEIAASCGAALVQIRELAAEESHQLLEATIGQARVAAEPEAAIKLGELLQYLPLAVAIAAQFLVVRPRHRLVDMVQHLQQAQHRLDLRVADRAVRTAFVVSWQALDDEHRYLFATLGLFEGHSFCVEAVAAVANTEVDITQHRLEMLRILSLVNIVELERYQQHALLADFAAEQLTNPKTLWQRLGDYYLALGEQHKENGVGLNLEWENIQATMRALHTDQQWLRLVRFAQVLTKPWFMQARYSQAQQGYTWALQAAEKLQDYPMTGFILHQAGRAYLEQDRFEEAQRYLQRSLEIYFSLEEDEPIAQLYIDLARMAVEQADYQTAERQLALAEQIYRFQQRTTGLARVFYQQASVQYDRGDITQATELCAQALAFQLGDTNSSEQLPTLRLLTDLAIAREDYETAIHYSQWALQLCEEFHIQSELAAVLYQLAVIERIQNRVPTALEYAQQALERFEKMGDPGFTAVTLYEISRNHALQNNLPAAYQYGLQSANRLREIGQRFNLVYVLRHLGQLAHQSQDFFRAHTFLDEGIAIAATIEHPLTAELRQLRAELLAPA